MSPEYESTQEPLSAPVAGPDTTARLNDASVSAEWTADPAASRPDQGDSSSERSSEQSIGTGGEDHTTASSSSFSDSSSDPYGQAAQTSRQGAQTSDPYYRPTASQDPTRSVDPYASVTSGQYDSASVDELVKAARRYLAENAEPLGRNLGLRNSDESAATTSQSGQPTVQPRFQTGVQAAVGPPLDTDGPAPEPLPGSPYQAYRTGQQPAVQVPEQSGRQSSDHQTGQWGHETGRHAATYESGQATTFDAGRQTAAYDTGQQAAYDTGQQAAYDTGQQAAFDTGQQAAYRGGSAGVQAPDQNGHGTGARDYATGRQTPVYDTGQQPPVYDTGQQPPVYDTGRQAAYDTGQQAAYDTGQQAAYRAGRQAAYRTGQQAAVRAPDRNGYRTGGQRAATATRQYTDEFGRPRPGRVGRRHRSPHAATRRAAAARPARSAAYERVGNFLLIPLFWMGLAASMALVVVNVPLSDLGKPGAVLTALGRIAGMAGGYLLLMQILLKSRVAWLEMSIGANRVLRWHRILGPLLLAMVTAHIVLTVVGLARTDGVTLARETVVLLTTWEDMIAAAVAFGLLLLVSLLGIRWLRRTLPYEFWRMLHATGYLVLLLAYGHQYANGVELQNGGPAWWYWSALYALVGASLLWGRVVEPLWLNLHYRLRVTAVVPETTDTFSVYIGGRNLDDLDGRPGQFYRWRFLTGMGWWQSHPFSLSAPPNRKGLRLTIKAVGKYTRHLRTLEVGTRVLAEGPFGDFTADKRAGVGALLIAGGSGISPIRALVEDMPSDTLILYRASTADDLVFRKELEELARERGIHVQYILGSRYDAGPRQLASPSGLSQLVPDVTRRDIYLCGPRGMVKPIVAALRELGVPHRQIHLDPFEF